MSESASSTETLAEGLSLLVPMMLAMASASRARNSPGIRTRVVILDQVERSAAVFYFSGDGDQELELEALLGELSVKRGPLPASKASIEAMPRVVVTEEGTTECAICLEGYEVGGEAREMPCKHSFHSGCIEKWLGFHGSCPVCRFAMPVEEGDVKSGGGEGGERGVRVDIWISGAGDPIDLDSGTGRGDPMDVDSGTDRGSGAADSNGSGAA